MTANGPQTIFITGAANGIGRATAELFHGEGWLVGGYDLDAAGLDALQDSLGERCITGLLDVRDKAAFDAAMANFAEVGGGRLDVLFNNAGIAVGGLLEHVPFDKVKDMVDINFMGVLNGVHAALPLLTTTPGSLCFSTSSSAATFGTAGMATYSATKYAVKGLTEAMSVELARHGSRAADVSPGIIDTPLWDGVTYGRAKEPRSIANMAKANVGRNDASRTLPPEDVARCVWDAYHGDKIHYYIPPELVERDRAKAANPEALRDEQISRATS